MCTKYGTTVGVADVITCVKFFGDRFKGCRFCRGSKLPSPIDYCAGHDNVKRNNVMLNCMSLLLADIGKVHFFWRRQQADKFFGDGGGGLALQMRCLLWSSGKPYYYYDKMATANSKKDDRCTAASRLQRCRHPQFAVQCRRRDLY